MGVSVGVSVGGAVVKVAVGVEVAAAVVAVEVLAAVVLVTVVVMVVVPPILMSTYTSSPKKVPPAVDMRQVPRTEPVLFGAFIATDRSFSEPGLTALSKVNVAPSMASPPTKANLKPFSQAQVPLFRTRQVLVNVWPAETFALRWWMKL